MSSASCTANWWRCRSRLNVIRHLLDQVPHGALPRRTVRLPDRQPAGDYTEPTLRVRELPSAY